MKMPWTTVIEEVSSLVSEFIEDPDKKREIDYKLQDLEFGLRKSLLATTTTPKVDAFVKLLIAFRDIILPLLRPLGAAAMTAFGMYCHLKGVEIDGAVHAVMDGAFPAWGASRHVHKSNELKQQKQQKKEDNPFWFEE